MRLLIPFLLFSTFIFGISYEKVEDKNELKILTPDLRSRKTCKIRLSNGLEAVLISDPETRESAAALSVEAGSWQDPKEYPGMAHFLEHMLFMGTEAYPNESEYQRYVYDYGGTMNAYTASDRTVYGFSVKNNGFVGALSRFSHFFIDPLFSPSCINRELHAVDQEHGKNIENDFWRSYMVVKETGNQDHPWSNFSTGNAETLSGIPQEALKKWYLEHYSANRMHLFVISNLSLEEIVTTVLENFSPIVNYQLPPPTYPEDLFSDKQKGKLIHIKPIKDIKTLSLIWELPKEIALTCYAPTLEAISYSLSNGTETGLLKLLQNEELAEGISVLVERLSKESLIFMIEVTLTEHGVSDFKKVISHIYQALNHLKKETLPSYIFDDLQRMAILQYEYQPRLEAFDYAMDQVSRMVFEPLETFPYNPVIAGQYDPLLADQIFDTLKADLCLYVLIANSEKMKFFHQEKWTAAAYSLKEIPISHLLSWNTAKNHPRLSIPLPNPFLPTKLKLLHEEPTSDFPTSVIEEKGAKIFFQKDKTYRVPKTSGIFSLKTPLLDGTPRGVVLFDLLLTALRDQLEATFFYGNRAGVELSLSQSNFDFMISIMGYSEKIPLFLEKVFEALVQLSPTDQEFSLYKKSLLSSYDNASKELPFRQGIQFLNTILFNNSPSAVSKYQALKNVSYKDFIKFIKNAFKVSYTEGLVYGNTTPVEVEQIWNHLKIKLNPTPFPIEEHYKKGVLLSDDKQGPFMFLNRTERQGNSTVLVLHQGSFSHEKRGVQQILSRALKDDFYKTLRTKQQTGYIATAWSLDVEEQLFQFFAVQSTTHDPQELLARFELFLEEFSRNIHKKITVDRFERLKASLIEELEKPSDSLLEQGKLFYKIISKYKADFDWLRKRVAAVKAVSYEDFIGITQQMLSRSNLRRLAVLVEGVLPEKNQFRYQAVTEETFSQLGRYIPK